MTTPKTSRPYGLWSSPIAPLSLARGMNLSNVAWDQGGSLAWLEGRSDRNVLVVQPPDGQAPRDLNSELAIRAGVGYGGGDFTVSHGQAYFVEARSGRIYRQPLAHGVAKAITPAFGSCAAPTLSPTGEWLLFVRTYEGQDALEIVDSDGRYWPQKLAAGQDFYMQPAWHPGGSRIAWIDWNHPNMPWDGTFLRLARLAFSPDHLPVLEEISTVAGGDQVSIFQPEFSPDGRSLAYVSDVDGWWHLYVMDLDSGQHRQLTFGEAEHGAPAWIQGLRTYGFAPDGSRLFFVRNLGGLSGLWQLDLSTGHEQRLDLDEAYTQLDQISVSPHGIALLASGGQISRRVISLPLPGAATRQPSNVHIWRRATSEELPAETYSAPQVISWSGLDGGDVFGLYYPPASPRFTSSGTPPVLVQVHGGPTSQVRAGFQPQIQFYTSRGYAFLDVNYRGSTGYGRAYRNMLRGKWGIFDVQDSVSGVQHLAGQGLVDLKRAVIMGGSAGGFTVLKALEDYPGFFKAGICLFGVSNQFTLAAETHKFEAHYSDSLLGPLPEAADVYRERSPIFFTDRIKDPMAVFQGEDDVVVPRKQSDELVDALRRRGVPHVYHTYAGEGHGFRKSETIEHYLKAVERFLHEYVIFA